MSAGAPMSQSSYVASVASAAVARGITAGGEEWQRLQLDALDFYQSYIQSANAQPRTGTDPGA